MKKIKKVNNIFKDIEVTNDDIVEMINSINNKNKIYWIRDIKILDNTDIIIKDNKKIYKINFDSIRKGIKKYYKYCKISFIKKLINKQISDIDDIDIDCILQFSIFKKIKYDIFESEYYEGCSQEDILTIKKEDDIEENNYNNCKFIP